MDGNIPCDYPSDVITFDINEPIVIEAIPQEGYHFAGWEGEPTINERDNPLEIEIDNNMALTATFAPDFYEYTADNGLLTVAIPDGATALDGEGEPITEIIFSAQASPPSPPAQTALVGHAFYLEPDNTTFKPEAILKWSYNPDDIPEGASIDDLVIAYYDEAGGEWTLLRSEVDTEDSVITADINHLSTFAILVPLPLVPVPNEAHFTTSGLIISPVTTGIGGTVSISVSLTNSGGAEGTTMIPLKVNNEVEDTSSLTLAGGMSHTVDFTVTPAAAGTYTVDVNGLRGSFTVTSEVISTPTPGLNNEPPSQIEENNTTATTNGINWMILAPIIVAIFLAIFLPIKLKKRHYDW